MEELRVCYSKCLGPEKLTTRLWTVCLTSQRQTVPALVPEPHCGQGTRFFLSLVWPQTVLFLLELTVPWFLGGDFSSRHHAMFTVGVILRNRAHHQNGNKRKRGSTFTSVFLLRQKQDLPRNPSPPMCIDFSLISNWSEQNTWLR